MDETCLKVAEHWRYLYRVIDTDGTLVDVYLTETSDQAAAEALFRSTVEVTGIILRRSPRSSTSQRDDRGRSMSRGVAALRNMLAVA